MGVFVFVCAEFVHFSNVCSNGDWVNECVYMRSSLPAMVGFVEDPGYVFVHVDITSLHLEYVASVRALCTAISYYLLANIYTDTSS